MAVQGSVPGSGYGNAYVDALVWGAAWTQLQAPIRYWFGTGTLTAADSPTDAAFTGAAWTTSETGAFIHALEQFSEVCNLRFEYVPSAATADMIWWKGSLPGLLGVHEVPEGADPSLDGVFNHVDTSWSSLRYTWGSYAYTTVLHEIGHGVGLAHPHDGGSGADATTFPGVPDGDDEATGTYALNQGIWTVMSYVDGWKGAQHTGNFVSYDYGWAGSPMAFDVAALQAIYGANTATRTGSDSYELPRVNASNAIGRLGASWSCIWDAGGIDTISHAAGTVSARIDLRAAPLSGPDAGGYISRVTGVYGGLTIAHGVVIENATGGSGNDELVGNDADNGLAGMGGGDTLDGGSGIDTAIFRGRAREYSLYYVADGTIIVTHQNTGIDGIDTLRNVEVLDFTDRDLSLAAFKPMEYLAANNDLLSAWGFNTQLATQHYVTNGFHENRPTAFDALRYTASYADLIQAFGTNREIATQHYLTNGHAEGRRVTFDGNRYLASYTDLLVAFGGNVQIATQHYITDGFREGRQLTFDGLAYIASHGDLIYAFGTNTTIATQHYVTNGFAEGRRVTFDGYRYLASNEELLVSLQGDPTKAAQHYIQSWRADSQFQWGDHMGFQAMRYIAGYADLIQAFGTNGALAARHYVTDGFHEGRRPLFDAELYLAKYADLRGVFGFDTEAASRHYIEHGIREGRNLGTAADDVLVFGPGEQRIDGGAGQDTLTGGEGADTFVFTAAADAAGDVITDFVAGVDRIDLSAIDANPDTPQDEAFHVLGKPPKGAVGWVASTWPRDTLPAPQQVWLYGGNLHGNTDYDPEPEFTIVGVSSLGSATGDFIR